MTLFLTLRFLHLVAYFFIASQAGYYLLCFYRVLKKLSPEKFVEIRKLTDPLIEGPLKFFYMSGLLLSVILIFWSPSLESPPASLSLIIAGLLLIIDMVLARMFNIPINKTINNLQGDEIRNASTLQERWLHYIYIRILIALVGFIVLMAGLLAP
jgi:Na+/H+ antiporter NhaD/arsenite permease-like protein